MAQALSPVRAAIALGSNLGDREAHLRYAIDRLGCTLASVRVSALRQTTHVGVGLRPPYLNGALVGFASLGPRQLLHDLLAIERARGRQRPFPDAPRTLDLDLILYGEAIVDTPDLTVPHPRFRERPFVLEPLAEVAPDLRDPVTGRTVGELWDAWRRGQVRP